MIDHHRLSYEEAAQEARNSILTPEAQPSAGSLKKLYEVADFCERFYFESPGDADLVGLFLFSQREQPGIDKNTAGLCHIWMDEATGERDGIIGLSVELLKGEPVEYAQFVFMHELAHLTDIEHNDRFQEKFNSIMVGYFTRTARADSLTRRRKAQQRHWF